MPDGWFKLPVPPSTNNLYVNKKEGGRAKSAKYRRWVTDCTYFLKTRIPENNGTYAVEIVADFGRHRDIDNIAKPVLDVLKKAGHIRDDRYVDDIRLRRGYTAYSKDYIAVKVDRLADAC